MACLATPARRDSPLLDAAEEVLPGELGSVTNMFLQNRDRARDVPSYRGIEQRLVFLGNRSVNLLVLHEGSPVPLAVLDEQFAEAKQPGRTACSVEREMKLAMALLPQVGRLDLAQTGTFLDALQPVEGGDRGSLPIE